MPLKIFVITQGSYFNSNTISQDFFLSHTFQILKQIIIIKKSYKFLIIKVNEKINYIAYFKLIFCVLIQFAEKNMMCTMYKTANNFK